MGESMGSHFYAMTPVRPVLVLLLVVGLTASPAKDQCEPLLPNTFRNAEYTGDGRIFYVGDKVEVQCRPGYKQISQSLQAWCTKEKRWTLLGDCKRILCNTQKEPINGNMIYTGNVPGSYVTFSCNGGYRYAGSKYRTCRQNGTWSGTSGACEEIICPPPPDLIYGGYRQGGPYKYGAELTVECDEDVIQVGSKTRTCLEDSTWSGEEANCTAVEDIFCPPPKQAHVQTSPTGRYNDTIEVRCVNGSQYNGSIHRQCQGDGTWSGVEGTCEEVYCKVPNDTDYNVVKPPECDQDCKYGTNVMVACRDPYSYNKTAHVHTCGADGEWQPQIGTCFAHEPTGEVNNFLEEPWYIWFLIIIGIIVLIAFIVTLGFSALSGSRPIRLDKLCALKLSTFGHKLGLPIFSGMSIGILEPVYNQDADFMKRRLIFHKKYKPITNFKVKDVILNKNNDITYLEGRVGVGKTAFVKNLLKNLPQWADNNFEATFLVDLHYVFRSGSVKTSLKEFLLDRRRPRKPLTKRQIDYGGKGMLVILDGLEAFRQSLEDDLVEKTVMKGKKYNENWSDCVAPPSDWIILILKRKVLMEAGVVVTSRKKLELKLVKDLKHNSIEILTPGEEHIMKFVSKYYGPHIQDILSSNNFLLSACVQPDICKLICQVLEDVNSETNLHRNQNQHHHIDLDEVVTHTRLMDFVTRPHRTTTTPGDWDEKHILIFPQNISVLQPLCHLAYDGLFGHGFKENNHEFGNDDLRQAGITGEIEWELQSRGFLIPSLTRPVRNGNISTFGIRRSKAREKLQKFSHPTYQEYLAIVWLAAGQEDANDTVVCLSNALCNSRFHQAPLYVCGLSYDSYCSSVPDHIRAGKPRIGYSIDTIKMAYDITDHLLLVQAAHETQEEENARKLLKNKFQNEKILIKESFVSAFAVKSLEYVFGLGLGLTRLSLEGVDMDEGSWKQLRDFLCLNTTLKELSLDHTYLWEKSLECLKAGLRDNTGITHLSLRDTGIDDRGILYIVTAIMENTSIAVLSLHENPVSRKEILNFKRYLQGVHREILKVEEEKMREDGLTEWISLP